MKARSAIFTFFLVAGLIFIFISGINFAVDPMCYYRCNTIEINKKTVNTYYRIGQITLAHPDTETIMIGSSRGETTSPVWLEQITGQKALNLSVGGTELQAKFAFLNIALQNNKAKQIIWEADFFELIPEILDVKMKSTEALRAYLTDGFDNIGKVTLANKVSSLFDHITFEASIGSFKKKNQQPLNLGSGSDLNFEKCQSTDYKGEQDQEKLNKEIVSDWDRYHFTIFKNKASEKYWDIFVQKMNYLSSRNIEVLIFIGPYNPVFANNLKSEMPDVYQAHLDWIKKIESLNIPHVKVLNYFTGIPGDDGSVRFWNDGVHFTCKAAIQMLKPSLAH